MIPTIPDVGARTRRRIAWRLLPFVFLLHLVAFLDRANVSFAALKMNLDLGFSDRVYGLGVAMFFVGYVLFEVPGAHHRGGLGEPSVVLRTFLDFLSANADAIRAKAEVALPSIARIKS
jgi:hypothetical protein